MANWLDSYKESVSWGDQIHAETVDGIDCCWVEVDGKCVFSVPGTLDDVPGSIANAVAIKQAFDCDCRVLFADEEATQAQVEQAMHATAHEGIGCGFIEPRPSAYYFHLLDLYSEGTLLESAQKEAGQ